MARKKQNDKDQAQEPEAVYSQKFVFFNSFEEMNEHDAKQSAALSHDERLEHIELLRKMAFSQHLQDDGRWPPLAKKFKIMSPYTNDTGE